MESQKAQENLQFIRTVMEDSRRSVADNGMHYISWSVVTALGIIGTYIVVMMQKPGFYILGIWALAVGLGWLSSFVIGGKGAGGRPVTFAEKMLTSVWAATGITMTITAFAGILTGAIHPNLIPAFIATIIGIPYFLSGIIYNLNWFKMLAVVWWAAGLVFFIWQSFHTLAVLGGLMIFCQALPGLYLYRKFNREHKTAADPV